MPARGDLETREQGAVGAQQRGGTGFGGGVEGKDVQLAIPRWLLTMKSMK